LRHPHRSSASPASCQSRRKTPSLADKITPELPLILILSSVPTPDEDQLRADEKLTAFLELETAIRPTSAELQTVRSKNAES
jgi:hypothetical protein